MSEKTKIVVIHMKELLYTIIFTILIVILVIVLVCMFLPGTDKNASSKYTEIPSEAPVSTEENVSFD